MALEDLYEPTKEELAQDLDAEPAAEKPTTRQEAEPVLDGREVTSRPESRPSEDGREVTSRPDPSEARARAQGWVPKEEWKGNPATWKPAQQWIEDGDTVKRLERQVQQLQGGYVHFVKAQQEQTRKAVEQARQQWEAEYWAKLKEFDFEGAQIADGKRKELDAQAHALEVAPAAPAPVGGRDPAYFAQWQARNTWYHEANPALWQQATAYGQRLERAGVPYAEMLALVEERFASGATALPPTSPGNSPVEAPRGGPSVRKNGGSRWGELDADAKKDFGFLVRNGVYADTDKDRAHYAKEVLEG